ncbi:hypothetical protein C0V73_15665 [Rhizobium sp. TH135]|nr:hypothetical protein C0V73_15665 [Rhizobium sp. TH135]
MVLGFPKDIEPEMFGTDTKAMITVSFECFAPGDHGLSGTISVRTIRGNLFPRTQAMHDDFVEQEQ